jgi:CNT family concentrative nucleoside transporter
MLGGLMTLVPERRDELLVLAPKTVLSGTLVNCLTGTVVGLVLAPGA